MTSEPHSAVAWIIQRRQKGQDPSESICLGRTQLPAEIVDARHLAEIVYTPHAEVCGEVRVDRKELAVEVNEAMDLAPPSTQSPAMTGMGQLLIASASVEAAPGKSMDEYRPLFKTKPCRAPAPSRGSPPLRAGAQNAVTIVPGERQRQLRVKQSVLDADIKTVPSLDER